MEKKNDALWVIDIFILLASMIFAILFLADTYDMENIASGLLPNIVAVVCIIFCLSIIVAQIISIKKGRSSSLMAEEQQGPHDESASPAGGLLAWWWSYVSMVGYFLFVLLIGLTWATLLYTLTVPFFMHYKNWKITVITSMFITACMYISFSLVLKIKLPAGILF